MLPNFVIIGTQKAATTFLHGCISEHPEVWMPAEEIPAFESPEYENGAIDDLNELLHDRPEKIIGISFICNYSFCTNHYYFVTKF